MRGSPLVRSLIVSVALLAAGAALLRLTASTPRPTGGRDRPPAVVPSEPPASIPFRLTLSSPAREITLGSEVSPLAVPAAGPHTGLLPLSGSEAPLFLTVRWQTPPAAGEHRFAKLILELPGKPTFSQVFDAPGDIDDVIELP